MRALAGVLCCLVFVSLSFAVAPRDVTVHAPGNGSLDQVWGPDVYGYVARDNLDANGPAHEWTDISGSGTQVNGLADDNLVGPFPLGLSFHFYWYDVNQFWVGSNGYVQFGPGGLLAQTFDSLPWPEAPNNFIAPYMADWLFGTNQSSRCYYENRGSDTLIVMWKNVRAWSTGGGVGNHNFELILSGVDSSITFQYDTLTASDVSNNNIAAGIENITGTIGIGTRYNTYPRAHAAVKFYYPPVDTFRAHDLTVNAVQNPASAAIFMIAGQTLAPWVSVRNFGNQPESNDTVRYTLRQVSNNNRVSSDSTIIGPLNPFEVVSTQFPPRWTASGSTMFKIWGRVVLVGDSDIYAIDDSMATGLRVISLPGELAYDDGSSEQNWSWDGGQGGMAMQFVPPIYPCRLDTVKYYLTTGEGVTFRAQVLDDTGPDGSPGAVLWEQDLNVTAPNTWVKGAVNPPLTIRSGAFYVAWIQNTTSIGFGLDTIATDGFSRRTWEFSSDVWSESRSNQTGDAMIRVKISRPPNQPPGPFARVLPRDTILPVEVPISMNWTRAVDADSADTVRYIFHAESRPEHFEMYPTDSVLTDTTIRLMIYIPLDRLDDLRDFYWTVRATDGHDTVMATNGEGHFRMDIQGAADDPNGIAVIRDYRLSCFPNPFNPVTRLSFDLPNAGPVTLKVFNLKGEEVCTLVNKDMPRGRYSQSWDAREQASGTYFAVLRSGSHARVQKILLLK